MLRAHALGGVTGIDLFAPCSAARRHAGCAGQHRRTGLAFLHPGAFSSTALFSCLGRRLAVII